MTVTAPSHGPTHRRTDFAPDVVTMQGRRAGIVTRGLAFAVDWGIVLAGVPVIMWGIGVVQGLLNFETPTYPDLPDWMPPIITGLWTFWYFVGLWWFAGRTVGSVILGVRVVGRRHPSVGLLRSTIRFWVMVSTMWVLGEVWLALAKSRLALHDRAAGTQVIYDGAEKKREVHVALAPEGADDRRDAEVQPK
jgi:uncharacterized RDD family membrane protein YckC